MQESTAYPQLAADSEIKINYRLLYIYMGHCSDELNHDSNTKLTEKTIDSKSKEKVKNNTYDKIKHIVSGNGNGKRLDEKVGVSPQPKKNKINIGF